jgi:hypothetical protein
MDLHEIIEDFIQSDAVDNIVAYRVKESLYRERELIDSLEHKSRVQAGLSRLDREDLSEAWDCLEALTKTYIYFSGDFTMKNVEEWHQNEVQDSNY